MDYNYYRIKKLSQKIDDVNQVKNIFNTVGAIAILVTIILLFMLGCLTDNAPSWLAKTFIIISIFTTSTFGISYYVVSKCENKLTQYDNRRKHIINDAIFNYNKEHN